MQEQIEARLEQLKAEFESGQRLLEDLEAQQAGLRSTLLRISGAMQVLEELLNGARLDSASPGNAQPPPELLPTAVPDVA